jgi:sporulation protein YlmC with PRC-barrel domain
MYLSGVLGTYNAENPDYMYIKIVSSEGNKSFTTFMVRVNKGPLADKLKGVPAGSVIGLHNCRLGEPYVTKPFIPKGKTEPVRVTYNHIVHVEDIICPSMQGKTIKQQSFTDQQMDDLVDSLG